MIKFEKNRIYFYLLISLLVNALNFFGELEDEGAQEAIIEALVLLPSIYFFIIGVYMLRFQIKQNRFYKKIICKANFNKNIFWVSLIVIKSIIFSFIFDFISILFFNDDPGEPLFDSMFWIIFISILFVIILVYILEAFIETQIEQQKIKLLLSKLEQEKSIAKYNALKNQINPHFLFNSFNSLISLISTNQEKAEFFLQELANIYRYVLYQSEETVVSLKKELKLINSYIALQKIRHGENLVIEKLIDADQLGLLLPPMSLEVLVENSIKHNIIEKSSPLKIKISTYRNFIQISNNYQPKKAETTENRGIGQQNLINRYRLINQELPVFFIKNNEYIARIPLIEPEL